MAISSEQQKSRNIFQRATLALRYGRDLTQVEDYQVGDIRSEQGLFVLPHAAVVGDITAPKVIVAGLVFGFIEAREVTIEAGGQVWGDVFAAVFSLEDGGKVHGWISSPDEEIGEGGGLFANGLDEQLTIPPELETMVTDFSSISPNGQSRKDRLVIWRQLQAEAAVAITARLELERSFGSRVDEVAGESLSESARLRDEVSIFREERTALQDHIEALEGQIARHEEMFETKSAELSAVQGLLDDKAAALDELQSVFEQQNLKTTSYEASRLELEKKLAQQTKRSEELTERAANLESALQGSLQHTAEQEEALIRWQELAEITDSRAKTLEDELEAVKLQLKESNQVVDMLRTQRDKLEKEWDKANKDLMEVAQDRAFIKADLDKKTEALVILEKERAKLHDSLDGLYKRYESQPPEYELVLEKLEMATANNADLKERLHKAEREMQDYHEQWLWTKASLDTAYSELDALRLSVDQYEEKIQILNDKLTEQAVNIEHWKTNVGRMTNLLFEAQSRAKTLEEAAQQSKGQAVQEEHMGALQNEIRKQQHQIEAYEAEVTHIHEEIEKQRQRLAENQANLVEREIALAQARETAVRQAAQLEQIKRLAGKRIQNLETELNETRQKLKDLSIWLERRQRRGEKLEPPG